jgi:hypothetical protein
MTPWATIVCLTLALLTVNEYFPVALSDDNSFLKEFLDSDLLSTIGFMASISLAGATSIHFALNDLELREGRQLVSTKRSVRRSATTLIVLFIVSLILVTIKPLFEVGSPFLSFINISAIVVLCVNALIMHDLLMTALGIPGFRQEL